MQKKELFDLASTTVFLTACSAAVLGGLCRMLGYGCDLGNTLAAAGIGATLSMLLVHTLRAQRTSRMQPARR